MPPVVCQVNTLQGAAREFGRNLAPRLLAAELALLIVARSVWGEWAIADTVVLVALIGLQPFTEWLIHVFVLHCPANGGLRDRLAGYSHRRHHEVPKDLRFQFIHPRAVAGGAVINALVILTFRSPTAVSWGVGATGLTLVYEWVHFLIHTDYAPRHELYRRLHRAHRLHHFRNEKYWLGVTGRTGDRVLGTNPRKEDIEISATARTALATR